MEVIYTGLHQTPEQIVHSALRLASLKHCELGPRDGQRADDRCRHCRIWLFQIKAALRAVPWLRVSSLRCGPLRHGQTTCRPSGRRRLVHCH